MKMRSSNVAKVLEVLGCGSCSFAARSSIAGAPVVMVPEYETKPVGK